MKTFELDWRRNAKKKSHHHREERNTDIVDGC
jgi:hypothetical protein